MSALAVSVVASKTYVETSASDPSGSTTTFPSGRTTSISLPSNGFQLPRKVSTDISLPSEVSALSLTGAQVALAEVLSTPSAISYVPYSMFLSVVPPRLSFHPIGFISEADVSLYL